MKVSTILFYVWLVLCLCCCYNLNGCFFNVGGVGVYGCDHHYHNHNHYHDDIYNDATSSNGEEEEEEEEEVLALEEEEERLLRTRPHIDKDVQVPPRGGTNTIPNKKKLKGKLQKKEKFQRCGTREPSTSEVRMVQHNLSKLHHERQRQRERRQMMMEGGRNNSNNDEHANSDNNNNNDNTNANNDSTSLLLNHVDRILQGTTRIEIPVIFHVISNTNGDGNIDDIYVQRQVDVLNESFQGTNTISPSCDGATSKTRGNTTPFVFILQEINRITNDEYFEANAFDGEFDMRNTLHKGDPCTTLNIYTKTFVDYYGNDAGLLGWSSFPWDGCPNNINDGTDETYKQQGVTLNYKTLPGFAPDDIAPYEQGITLPHEIGHYFGIFHTFQTSGIFGSCYGIGDGIADTAPGIGAASGCNQQLNTCPGIAGYDSVTNFMNYSNDCCMDTFTPMQIEAMVLNYHLYFKNDET